MGLICQFEGNIKLVRIGATSAPNTTDHYSVLQTFEIREKTMTGTGRTDHICSGRTCMFCRVLDNPQRTRQIGSQNRQAVDSQVLERVRELESRSLLQSTSTN